MPEHKSSAEGQSLVPTALRENPRSTTINWRTYANILFPGLLPLIGMIPKELFSLFNNEGQGICLRNKP